MAGLGFKDFQVGEVLTSSDVDGYLMQQTVMRFADAAARGSALGTAVGTGVPLAEGMMSYLDDANYVQVYNGSGWTSSIPGIGSNAVQTVKTDTFTASLAAGSAAAVTGLTASITPTSAASKVLVIAELNVSGSGGTIDQGVGVIVKRDVTAIGIGDAASSRGRFTAEGFQNPNHGQNNIVAIQLDSPGVTTSVTYSVEVVNGGSTSNFTINVNRTNADADAAYTGRTASRLTLIEVAV